jgi:hypothetical protein
LFTFSFWRKPSHSLPVKHTLVGNYELACQKISSSYPVWFPRATLFGCWISGGKPISLH